MWESKDDRKWGHDKFEELTMHERHHEGVNTSTYASFICASDENFAAHSLYELNCRVEGVLGDAIEAATEIEPQTLDLHQ